MREHPDSYLAELQEQLATKARLTVSLSWRLPECFNRVLNIVDLRILSLTRSAPAKKVLHSGRFEPPTSS
jgi:hypothetical protein